MILFNINIWWGGISRLFPTYFPLAEYPREEIFALGRKIFFAYPIALIFKDIFIFKVILSRSFRANFALVSRWLAGLWLDPSFWLGGLGPNRLGDCAGRGGGSQGFELVPARFDGWGVS